MVPNSKMVTKVGELKNVIIFGFYKKPMANKCGNLKRSGLPEQQKFNTAVQEVLRRLKNTSRELSVTEYEVRLGDYMGELAMGGYSHQWRCEVLLSAIKGYSRIWDLEVTGKGYVNRPNHVTAVRRRANKLIGKSNWFKATKEKGQQNTTRS